MAAIRISESQSNTLLALHMIEQQGKTAPVPAMRLYDITCKISNKMTMPLKCNYRKSCHKLVEHGYLNLYRNDRFEMAFSLTDQGREKGANIAQKMQTEAK